MWSEGNPTKSTIFEDAHKEFRTDTAHKQKGDSCITPWELIKLRNALLFQNSVHLFVVFTMLLVAIKGFYLLNILIKFVLGGIRAGFLTLFTFDTIIKDLCIIKENGFIEGLGIQWKVPFFIFLVFF